MQNGYYAYYTTPTSVPLLCEKLGNYIAQVGEEGWRPLRIYQGRFVKLVEVQDEVEQPSEEQEVQA